MSPTQSTKREGYMLVGTLLFAGLMGAFLLSYVKVWSTADIRSRETELKFSLVQIQRGIDRYKIEYGYPPRMLRELERGSYIRRKFRDPFRGKRDSKWFEDWNYANGRVSSRSNKESLLGSEYSGWRGVKKQRGYEIVVEKQEKSHGG